MVFKLKNITLLLVVVINTWYVHAQSVEYHIKASLMEKFAEYTEWDSNTAFEDFTICVLGKSPFKGELEKIAAKTKVKGKTIKIIYANNTDEINNAQLLFICSSEESICKEIIRKVENKNILLVGDTPGYAGLGVHFNFYFKKNNTIHFEVNPVTIKKAKLRTDLQLINLGKIIEG